MKIIILVRGGEGTQYDSNVNNNSNNNGGNVSSQEQASNQSNQMIQDEEQPSVGPLKPSKNKFYREKINSYH